MYRSVKDDAAVIIQQRSGCIDGKESAIEVGVDDVLKDGFVGRARRRSAGDAGICEDDVEPAEISGKCCEEPLAVFGYGDVCAVAARARSKFGDSFVQRLLVTAGNGDLGAFRNENAGSGKTDAAVASGDESFLSCEFHNFPLSWIPEHQK